MSKKIILPLLILATPSIADAAVSAMAKKFQFQTPTFKACQDTAIITKDFFEKGFEGDKDFFKNALAECGPGVVQVLPEAGFMSKLASALDSKEDTGKSVAFLEKVGRRAKQYVELNNEMTEQLRRCALGDKAWFDAQMGNADSAEAKAFYNFDNCDDHLDKLKDSIKEIGSKARISRAAIGQTGGKWDGFGTTMKTITSLNGLLFDGQLPFEKQAPSADEVKEAKKITDKESATFETEFQEELKTHLATIKGMNVNKFPGGMAEMIRASGTPQWFQNYYANSAKEQKDGAKAGAYGSDVDLESGRGALQAMRFAKHQEDIVNNFQQVPVLAFLNNANPDNKELAEALGRVIKNGEGTKKEIEGLMAEKGTSGRGKGQVQLSAQVRMKKMLELMKFGPVVEEVLAEDTTSCGTAAGIANVITNTEVRNNVALIAGMIGTVGAAAVVGPVVVAGSAVTAAVASTAAATGVGMAFTAGIMTSDAMKYVAAKRRTFSVATTMDGKGKNVADFKSFEEARDMLVMDIATAPLDLVGTGLFSGALSTASAAVKGARISARAQAVLGRRLASKGLDKKAVDGLFKGAMSDDISVAGPAAVRLLAEAGASPAKVKVLRIATAKGLLKKENTTVSAIADAMKGDAKVDDKAIKILESINSAKINEGNRADAMAVAMAGAEFGVTNPAALAAKINDWDQGLDGLAAAYRKATVHMNDPDIAKIAKLEDRQKAALERSIREMSEKNPEFKALPKTEQDKIVTDMGNCGNVGIGKI